MSNKANKQVAKAAASKAEKPEGGGGPTKAVAVSPILVVVKKDAKLRGARDAWYQLLGKYDGKPVAEFYEAARATPPALTKAQTAEDPRGWVRYFVRTGVAELQS
jgi:hypothetical protein